MASTRYYISFLLFLLLSSNFLEASSRKIEELPLVDKVWIGSEKGIIRANEFVEIFSQTSNKYLLLVKDQQWIKKGTHWATVAPDTLEIEKKSLDLSKKKTAYEISQLQDKELEATLVLKNKLNEIETNKQKLLLLSEQDQLPKETKQQIRSALLEIDKQEARITERLQPEELNTPTLLKKNELILALEKREKAYKDLLHLSELKAPITGRITLHLDSDQLQEVQSDLSIWINTNIILASFIDNKQYNVELQPLAQNLYTASPGDTTMLIDSAESGHMLRADFSKIEIVKNSNSMKKWIFNIHPNDAVHAPQSAGQLRIVHLFKKLDKPCHVILKKDISTKAPKILKKDGWEALVKHLWPKANIVFIGPQAIAIKANGD